MSATVIELMARSISRGVNRFPVVTICRPICAEGYSKSVTEECSRHCGTDVFSDSSGAVQAQQQGSLQLRLCSLNFNLRRCQGHSGPLLQGKVGEIINGGQAEKAGISNCPKKTLRVPRSLFSDTVDTPQTSVRVRSRERHEAVGQVVARDDVAQFAAQHGSGTERSIPVAHDAGKNHHGEVVG